MLGVFAEFERATLIDRVIAGMERKAARGEWLGGQAPYGYRLNRETALLEPNEAEAPIARLIFDLYTKKRLGARGVANFLSHHGYPSRPGQLRSHVAEHLREVDAGFFEYFAVGQDAAPSAAAAFAGPGVFAERRAVGPLQTGTNAVLKPAKILGGRVVQLGRSHWRNWVIERPEQGYHRPLAEIASIRLH